MHFYGLIDTAAENIIDKTVPLVAYDDQGVRRVVGKAKTLSIQNGFVNVEGEITDPQLSKALFSVTNAYSIQNQPKDTIMYPNDSFVTFVRKPFLVTAVQITDENIDELAGLVGEVKEKEDGTKYIALDRRIIPNIRKAYVGWWITKLDDNIRCYSPKVFGNEFVDYDEGWEIYFDQIAAAEAIVAADEAFVADVASEEVHPFDVPAPQVGAFGRVLQTDPPADGFDVVK